MKNGILIGISRYLPGNGCYLEQEDGSNIYLTFENEQRVDELIMNIPVAVVIEDGKVPDKDNFWQEVPVFSAGSRNDTTKYIAMGGINFTAPHRDAVRNFWLTFAHKFWDIRVFSFEIDEEGKDCNYMPNTYCGSDLKRSFDDLPDDVKPDWNPDYWYVYGGYHRTYCGQAILGGRNGVSYVGNLGCGGADVVNHELGHNFGLHHASTNYNGNYVEYGDGTSIMGNRKDRQGLNAVNMYHLGLYDQDEIVNVTKNTELVICPHEIPKEARFSNESVYNIIKGTDGKMYMVSTRKHRGGQHILKNLNNNDSVWIHEMRNYRSVLVDAISSKADNQVSTIIPGVKLTHLEYSNEVSRVRVEFDNDTTKIESNEIITEPFPEKFAQIELSEDHDGLWYDPIRNGQGLDLHIKDGKAVLSWYHYPDDKPYGTTDWIISSFDIGEGIEKFDLWSTSGGKFENPASADKVKVGEGQIYFTGPDTGIFQYRTEKFGRGHFPISPVIRQTSPSNGAYYDPQRDGEGFTLRFLDDGERCVGYWYTYEHRINDPIKKYHRRRWFMLDGNLVDGKYQLKTYRVDGQFLAINVKQPATEELGISVLVPKTNRNFQFISTVPDYNIDIEIKRLF